MRYFGFSLLGIIMSFSGIYTSVLLKTFAPEYLTSYLISYAWGFALVLVVNVLVFPVSAERELREALVSSLERISTLAHLIAKVDASDPLEHAHSFRPTRSRFRTRSARFETRCINPSGRILPCSRSGRARPPSSSTGLDGPFPTTLE